MRAAPPVSVRCSGGRPWLALRAVPPGLAAAALAGWFAGLAELRAPVAIFAALLAAGVAALVAWRAAARRRPRELTWDGLQWRLDGQAGEPRVAIDAGAWLLLRHDVRCSPFAALAWPSSSWVAVSAPEAGPSFHLLRCALFARPAPSRPLPDGGDERPVTLTSPRN